MSAEVNAKPSANLFLGIATALMCALAAGAVWCVVQLYLRFDLIGFAFAVAAFIAWVLRRQGFGRRLSGALIAAFSTIVACVYAGYLLAAARVASFLGIPMRETLLTMGRDMATAVAWANLSGFHIATLVLAVILSAWLVWRKA
jgi:hypothetical protein